MSQFENRYASPSFLAKPPRHVPLPVRTRLLFGGFVNQFGWLFFGFGMIFVWVFVGNSDPMAYFAFRGELEKASGKIFEVVETNLSEGGNEHNDGTPIYRYDYRFEFDNLSFEGASYTLGKKKDVGATVTVEFPVGKPTRSRIQGMRTAAMSSWVLLVLIFPLVGGGLAISGFLHGRHVCKLLRIGEFTQGRLINKEPTNTRVNKQTVFKLTFEFQDESGQTRQAIAKTHETSRLEDDELEPLLYDPMFPEKATLLDHLAGRPEIDSEGNIKNSAYPMNFLCLVVPALSIVGHSIAMILIFLK